MEKLNTGFTDFTGIPIRFLIGKDMGICVKLVKPVGMFK
jgi:hypothetical protein